MKFILSLRGVGAMLQHMAPLEICHKWEAKQDGGSHMTSEIPSYLLGNSRPKQRMNCTIAGSCLTVVVSIGLFFNYGS